MTAFLRGPTIELRPVSSGERDRLAALPWLLRAGEEDILLSIAPPGAPPVGLVALCGIDWVRRTARVAAWWAVGVRAPPEDAAREALRLVVRYAADELNLDEIVADPADPAGAALLTNAGFVEGRWRRA